MAGLAAGQFVILKTALSGVVTPLLSVDRQAASGRVGSDWPELPTPPPATRPESCSPGEQREQARGAAPPGGHLVNRSRCYPLMQGLYHEGSEDQRPCLLSGWGVGCRPGRHLVGTPPHRTRPTQQLAGVALLLIRARAAHLFILLNVSKFAEHGLPRQPLPRGPPRPEDPTPVATPRVRAMSLQRGVATDRRGLNVVRVVAVGSRFGPKGDSGGAERWSRGKGEARLCRSSASPSGRVGQPPYPAPREVAAGRLVVVVV